MITMSMGIFHLIYLLSTVIFTTNCQYMYVSKKPPKTNPCDGSNKSALAEHFFNVIFSEFQSSPPVCVCVQMCADQPTYCYPNGCFKKTEDKKKVTEDNRPAPVTGIQNKDAKTMFIVDDKHDFTQMLMDNVDDHKHGKAEAQSMRFMFPDLFKDRYKLVFKYKKLPKVELKYNLREQVKNMKSDILKMETQDVSKTRWPKNQHKVYLDQKSFYTVKNNEKSVVDAGKNKFFLHSNNENDFSSKYFKRDLKKSEQDDNYGQVLKSDIIDKTFSLESLIENLLGNSFDGTNETGVELRVNFNDIKDNVSSELAAETSTNNDSVPAMKFVYTMKLTDERIDDNKILDDRLVEQANKKWGNCTFKDMITALAKRIDIQNKTSLEIMNRMTGNTIELPSEKNGDIVPERNQKVNENITSINITKKTNSQLPINETKEDITLENSNQATRNH